MNNNETIDVDAKNQILKIIYNCKYNNKEKPETIIDGVADLEEFAKKYDIKNYKENNVNDFLVLDYKFGIGTKEDPFYLAFSSFTLLKHSITQRDNFNGISLLGLDGTYKINELNYPLLVLGTQDVAHHSFPLAFAIVSSDEDIDSYSFVLRAFNKAIQKLFNVVYKPKFVISDGSPAIFTAISNVYGSADLTHLMCYRHLRENVRKQFAEKNVSKKERPEILSKIDFMQRLFVREHMNIYWGAFKKEYSKFPDFLTYFEETYVTSRLNRWHYYDTRKNVFLSNNAIESLNANIKYVITNREKLNIIVLINKFVDYLKFKQTENLAMTKSIKVKNNIIVKASEIAKGQLIIIHSGNFILERKLDKLPDLNECKSLITLKNNITTKEIENMYRSKVVLRRNNNEVTCFCCQGFKYGSCVHIEALKIHLKILSDMSFLVANRGGRKRKCTSALRK